MTFGDGLELERKRIMSISKLSRREQLLSVEPEL